MSEEVRMYRVQNLLTFIMIFSLFVLSVNMLAQDTSKTTQQNKTPTRKICGEKEALISVPQSVLDAMRKAGGNPDEVIRIAKEAGLKVSSFKDLDGHVRYYSIQNPFNGKCITKYRGHVFIY